MTNASTVKETGVAFDYGAEAELFPTRNRKSSLARWILRRNEETRRARGP